MQTFADPPFACPPDTVLDIPVPLSVNETRRVNRAALRKVAKWKEQAGLALMASGQFRKAQRFDGRYEIRIILCEKQCRLDADNPIKAAIDYVRNLGLVRNDDKRFLRRITVEWGTAPRGCRLILNPSA